jgi:hypothetical protein
VAVIIFIVAFAKHVFILIITPAGIMQAVGGVKMRFAAGGNDLRI